jgi:hypothetical protein
MHHSQANATVMDLGPVYLPRFNQEACDMKSREITVHGPAIVAIGYFSLLF